MREDLEPTELVNPRSTLSGSTPVLAHDALVPPDKGTKTGSGNTLSTARWTASRTTTLRNGRPTRWGSAARIDGGLESRAMTRDPRLGRARAGGWRGGEGSTFGLTPPLATSRPP